MAGWQEATIGGRVNVGIRPGRISAKLHSVGHTIPLWRQSSILLIALIPVPPDDHPLGCHRPRVPDRVCFEGILIRLTTGCAWVDAEVLMGNRVSDTTLRARRDERE